MVAASTLADSFGAAALQFAAAAEAAAADATALFNVVYGLDDGNDYGRYFYGQDPLVTFASSATSLTALIAQGAAAQAAVAQAAAALLAANSDPALFGPAASVLTEAVRTACANPGDAIRLLAQLMAFRVGIISGSVAADPLGAELYLLAARAATRLRLAAAGSLIRAAADYQPTSQQDALAISNSVASVLDQLALFCADVFDDATASALYAARNAVVEDLTARGAAVAAVMQVNLGRPLPAIVVAYRLYGDATRADEVLARNPVPHPGFMPLVLEVLSA